MKKGIITPEERDAINTANQDIINREDVIETLENLVLKIKIINLAKTLTIFEKVLNNPKEELQ